MSGNGLLSGETQGFAIDATVVGGSVSVIDTGTPANNLSNVAFASSNLVNNSASAKHVRDAAGTLTLTTVGDIPQSYDPATSRYGILVEAAATNLLLQSENFSTTWSLNNLTNTTNQTGAPNGAATADLLAETTANGSHFVSQGVAVTSGTTYTGSVYLKKGNGATAPDWMQLHFGTGGFGAGNGANFNLATGAVGTLIGSATAAIEALGNGWYRCSITKAATATTTSSVCIVCFTNNTDSATTAPTYVGVTTSDVFAWGAQGEAGSIPTSYIPTTTGTVTRAVDDITVATSTIPFLQNPGSMYVDYSQKLISAGDRTIASFNDGTDEDDEVLFQGSTANPLLIVTAGAAGQTSTDLGTLVANTRHQLSASWDTNDVDGSLDGAAPTNDATATMPTGMDELGIGNEADLATPLNGHIYRFVYVPRHVENDDGDLELWRYNHSGSAAASGGAGQCTAWSESWAGSWGESWGICGVVAPAVTIPPGGGKGIDRRWNYLDWWEGELRRILRERKKPKKKLPPKRQELVEELDEAVLEAKERLAETEATEAYAREMRQAVLDAAALINQAYTEAVSAERLRQETARLEAYVREMDDEETILLTLH